LDLNFIWRYASVILNEVKELFAMNSNLDQFHEGPSPAEGQVSA